MELLALFGVGTNLIFSLGVVFTILFVVFYMRQRLSDYQHKLNSMFQLISAMADEINYIKTSQHPIALQQHGPGDESQHSATINENDETKLVHVSDDEMSVDSDESDDDEEGLGEHPVENNAVEMERVIPSPMEQIFVTANLKDLVSTHSELTEDQHVIESNNVSSEVKVVEITDQEAEYNTYELQKYTVKQLRELCNKRNITSDVTKLKKHELLKILETNAESQTESQTESQPDPSNQADLEDEELP